MLTLHDDLAERVANWELLGQPALLERFVLRNGTAFTPRKRIGRKGVAKACFGNATNFVLKRAGTSSYVEGFARSKEHSWTFHHAWVTTDGIDAMDPTLDAEGYDYFGLIFSTDVLRKEMIRKGSYGLLDTGLGFNTDLIFKIDPELQAICDAVKAAGNQLHKKLTEVTNENHSQ